MLSVYYKVVFKCTNYHKIKIINEKMFIKTGKLSYYISFNNCYENSGSISVRTSEILQMMGVKLKMFFTRENVVTKVKYI